MGRESQFISTFASVKLRLIFGIILLSVFMSGFAIPPDKYIPEKGVLDLSSMVLDQNSLFNLNGEWEFYWEQLLTPDSYVGAKQNNSGILVTVPSYWKNYKVEGESPSGFGYGTYALTIILPPDHQAGICIDIPVFDVTHKFFLNNRLISENGTVGTTRDQEEPWYEPGLFCYIPDGDTLQLLIQVSNFHHRRGGFWKPVLIGGSKAIQNKAEHLRMFNYSTIGVLFFFTIFFMIFWLFSRRDIHTLLFALTTLGILIRSVNSGLYFSNSFVDTPWEWQIRMEYFGTYLAHMAGMTFLHRMFPKKYMKHVLNGNYIITGLLIISVFILPPWQFAYSMMVFQPLILIFLIHYLVISFLGTLRGRVLDAIFFVSLGLFIVTLVSDIMLANSAKSASANYISHISFQVFILAMSVLIIMQWGKNYNTRLRLEASLRFKNKVLSVIAHDLKGPVASIAQFSDLLTTKPELAGKKHILESLRESSQAAVTLLDNLLYWGRSQADELRVSPIDMDLESIVSELESLFAHMAIQKSITLTSSVYPGTRVYADKALVNIIIRNLVSNALKFTPRGGSVTIQAQPEGEKVRISVSDTGIGIKPEILEQFQKEGQLVSSTGTDKEIGTGLGLQLVSDLVAKNYGTLKVESTLEKGSTFTFTLPGRDTKNEQ